MFRTIRLLHDAITSLTSSVEALRDSVATARSWHETHGHVEARVEELERQRGLFEAEVTSDLLKAKTEYLKAASAEGRAKTAAAKAPKSDDGSDESDEELALKYLAWLQENDGAGGTPKALLEVPAALAGTSNVRDRLAVKKWNRR